MGYILLLVFILIWLNVRKIRKALLFLAVQEGYSGNLKTRILDVITDYAAERKDIKKTRRKVHREEKKAIKEHAEPVSEDMEIPPESEEQDEVY